MKLTNVNENCPGDNFTQLKLPILRVFNYISEKVLQLLPNNLEKLIKIGSTKNYKMPWWVEIKTAEPPCVYYFGPFDNIREARLNKNGYIEDLMEEKADGITVQLKQCLPDNLTIFAEI